MNRERTALRAQRVDDAAWFAQPLAQCAQTEKLVVASAYAVQMGSIGRRLARGEKRTGVTRSIVPHRTGRRRDEEQAIRSSASRSWPCSWH
jgi:2-keto-4-pentenoate hydratase